MVESFMRMESTGLGEGCWGWIMCFETRRRVSHLGRLEEKVDDAFDVRRCEK